MMNDIEYGGNDLLQVYNVQQLKNRLNSQGGFFSDPKLRVKNPKDYYIVLIDLFIQSNGSTGHLAC